MNVRKLYPTMIPTTVFILLTMVFLAYSTSRATTVIYEKSPIPDRSTIIIDAGHGGEDGGAISCTGHKESDINLDIALRLQDFLHLLGYQTRMIRQEDLSVYTAGETLSQKKISDLKERVRIIKEVENGLLLSIHQNTFPDGQYKGAQVFYSLTDGSKELAEQLQTALVKHLNPASHRCAKKAQGIYLMENSPHTSVLIECGFLSNPQEDALLRTDSYQTKLCAVIGTSIAMYLDG